MRIERLQATDREKWNAFVANHPEGTVYHRAEWMDAIQEAYGFESLALVAKNETGDIEGALPAVNIGWPVKKLSSLPYCDVGGVLATSELGEQALLAEAFAFQKDNNLKKLESRRSYSKDTELNLDEQPKVRMILPLPDSSEELLASFKSKLRSQINKAKKNGLTYTTGRSSEFVDAFYQVYVRNMRDLGSPAHSLSWFKNIVAGYGDDAVIANVWFEDKVVGAGIVLYSGKRASIPWASTIADYNKLAPNMLLYWALLEYSCERNAGEFDFGRSTPGEGTYKFKAQWGAKAVGLNWQDYADGKLLPQEKVQGKSAKREKIENIWRKLPVGLATLVGSKLRKYISL